ncbi:MAG TPA: hypothetical protein VFV08_02720 [Puia sp.]|nr:hypothetical protein [Puia sp.]
MKKSILTIIWLFIACIGFSFANGKDKGTDIINASLKRDFNNAALIRTDNYRAFTKATVEMNGRVLYAYYSLNGDLMGVAGNILSDKLPIELETELRSKYASGYWITDLFELSTDGTTEYFVTLESTDYVLILKSVESNGWVVYSKKRKEVE